MTNEYFTFQIAYENTNAFEIVFSPQKHQAYTNPQILCDFFNIKIEDYKKAALQYGARVASDIEQKFSPYNSILFMSKKAARSFIKDYLVHYVTAAKLMGKIK